MEKLFAALGIGVALMALVTLVAVLGGTFVWLVWPVAVPAAFPGLVASGTLAAKLTWWQSVCLTWLAAHLVKSTNTNNSNNTDK